MSVIANISREAAKENLPFLLIGGYAVLAHGFVRTTGDIDFLVRKSQAAEWQKLLEGLKFAVKFSGSTFLQFDPPPGEKLPLDLMFVADKNFDQMFSAAKQIETEGVITNVVSFTRPTRACVNPFLSRERRGRARPTLAARSPKHHEVGGGTWEQNGDNTLWRKAHSPSAIFPTAGKGAGIGSSAS